MALVLRLLFVAVSCHFLIPLSLVEGFADAAPLDNNVSAEDESSEIELDDGIIRSVEEYRKKRNSLQNATFSELCLYTLKQDSLWTIILESMDVLFFKEGLQDQPGKVALWKHHEKEDVNKKKKSKDDEDEVSEDQSIEEGDGPGEFDWDYWWGLLWDIALPRLSEEEIIEICKCLCAIMPCPPGCPGNNQPPWGPISNEQVEAD